MVIYGNTSATSVESAALSSQKYSSGSFSGRCTPASDTSLQPTAPNGNDQPPTATYLSPNSQADDHRTSPASPASSSDPTAPLPTAIADYTTTGQSTNSFADDPARTHRVWTPKYGRVQKCDFCNCRSPGTLHVCSTCSIHICEDCSRGGRWHSDRKHFIDPDACDWVPQKITRTGRSRGGRPRGRGNHAASDTTIHVGPTMTATTGPGEGPSTTKPRRSRRLSARNNSGDHDDDDHDDHDDHDHDDDDEHHDKNNYEGDYIEGDAGHSKPDSPGPKRRRLSSDDSGHPGASQESGGTETQQDTSHPVQKPGVQITAAATRPFVRQAAARAIGLLNEQAQRTQSPRSSEQTHRTQPQRVRFEDSNNVDNGEPEAADIGNDGRGNGSVRTVGVSSGGNSSNRASPQAGPSTTRSTGRSVASAFGIPDRTVLGLYEQAFGERPNWTPRIRQSIPGSWEGPRPAPRWAFHEPGLAHPRGIYNMPPQLDPYEQYHQHVYAATTQHQPIPFPVPDGYAEYSFQHFPTPIPTIRSTPIFHPYNELTPEEMNQVLNDRYILREMQYLWETNPQLVRMRQRGRGLNAIQALWGVFELRRRRHYLHDCSQTVRWFVAERDRLAGVGQPAPELARPAGFDPGSGSGAGAGYGSVLGPGTGPAAGPGPSSGTHTDAGPGSAPTSGFVPGPTTGSHPGSGPVSRSDSGFGSAYGIGSASRSGSGSGAASGTENLEASRYGYAPMEDNTEE
ncbi:hypothetical protein VTK56DRAFT_10233 [Thermocarpiscus australiensis]